MFLSDCYFVYYYILIHPENLQPPFHLLSTIAALLKGFDSGAATLKKHGEETSQTLHDIVLDLHIKANLTFVAKVRCSDFGCSGDYDSARMFRTDDQARYQISDFFNGLFL